MEENGGSLKGLCLGDYTNSVCIQNLFKPYFQSNKSCVHSANDGCWHKAEEWKTLNPNTACGPNAGIVTNCPGHTNSMPGNFLTDGTLITFVNITPDCNYSGHTTFPYCAYIMLDVNGFKKPNTLGRDIFGFWLTEKSVVPIGSRDSFTTDSCAPSGTLFSTIGWGCTAYYLLK